MRSQRSGALGAVAIYILPYAAKQCSLISTAEQQLQGKLSGQIKRGGRGRPLSNPNYFLVVFFFCFPKLVSTVAPMLASICLAGSANCPVG
jgi:hypothetical protein